MKRKIKLSFAELERELSQVPLDQMVNILGGSTGSPNYSEDVRIYGGTITNYPDGQGVLL
jgi:hypothetical protein